MKYAAFVLFTILVFAVLCADGERRRILEWYEEQTVLRQTITGLVFALFSGLVFAVVVVPIVSDWYKYFNP